APIGLAICLCMFMIRTGHTQNYIEDDGMLHWITYVGSYTDLVLPDNPLITDISFSLKGGDGGFAQASGRIDKYNAFFYKTKGGGGATVDASFRVGHGADKIPPGSTIRFVEGSRGANMSKI